MENIIATQKDLVTSNKNLEMQIGQIANAMNSREQGQFPSKTDVNPREHCKVITLRSGKQSGKEEEEKVDDEYTVIDGEKEPFEEFHKQKVDKSDDQVPKPVPPPVKPYVPPVPFLQRLQQTKLDKQFEKFLKVFRQCILTFLLQML